MMSFRRFFLTILSLFVAVLSTAGAAFAQDAADEAGYNPLAEQWIRQRLNAGQPANLYDQFPDRDDHRIRASFLIDLLDHPGNAVRLYGMTIGDAVIVGDFSFKNRSVDFPVFIRWSTFEGPVEFCSTHFQRYLSLQGDTFKSRVDFCGLKVDDDICLSGATFENSLEFGGARVLGSIVFDGARFTNREAKADLGSMKIQDSLYLNNAVFEGEAAIGFGSIGGDLQLNGAQFNNPDYPAVFSVVQVGRVLTIKEAVFAGGANFQSAQAGSLSAGEAQFLNKEQNVAFENFRADSMFFNNAVFNGPVSFHSVKIGGAFVATGAQFLHKDIPVSFVNMDVGETLYLDQAVFDGGADFRYGSVGKDFNLIKASFNNPEKDVMFQYVKVGNNFDMGEAQFQGKVHLGHTRTELSILLNKAVIDGPLDARFAWMGRNFEAMDAQFNDEAEGAYLESMQIGDHLLINRTTFAGPADFSYIQVRGFIGADDTRFDKAANFSNATAGKHIFINKAVFRDSVNFTNVVTHGFFADSASFPEEGRIDVRGMTYTELDLNHATPEEGYIYLLDQSPYDGRGYKMLEQYYRAWGHPAYADFVYVKYKFRETNDGLRFTDWQWWWNWFINFFIVYGKGPELAAFWFFLIVMFGWFMFRKEDKMTAKAEAGRKYRPLLYSLDLFLPLVNFGYADAWSPNPENKLIAFYAVIHRWLGLILIPLALLLFLGVLK